MRDRRAQIRDVQIQPNNENLRMNMVRLREAQAEQDQIRRLEARQFVVDTRRANDRQRQQVNRAFTSNSFLRLAFEYGPDIEYYAHSKVDINIYI